MARCSSSVKGLQQSCTLRKFDTNVLLKSTLNFAQCKHKILIKLIFKA